MKESLQSEQYIHFIAETSTPKAMTLQDIKRETRADATLQEAAKIIRKNNWHSLESITNSAVDLHELKLLRNIKNELTVSNETDLLLRGTRILIPRTLRHDAIRLAHIWAPRYSKGEESNMSKSVVSDDWFDGQS